MIQMMGLDKIQLTNWYCLNYIMKYLTIFGLQGLFDLKKKALLRGLKHILKDHIYFYQSIR